MKILTIKVLPTCLRNLAPVKSFSPATKVEQKHGNRVVVNVLCNIQLGH